MSAGLIGVNVGSVARGRVGHEVLTSKGDLISEELEEESSDGGESRVDAGMMKNK